MGIKNGDKSATPFQSCGPDGLPSHEAEFGLTKREIMAMAAMQGLLAGRFIDNGGHVMSEIPCRAARIADALLAELERTSTSK